MDLVSYLETLSNAAGVGGMPDAADAAQTMLQKVCPEIERDALGSVIGWRRCGKEGAPVVMLEAHIDEIGFLVTGVEDSGFVRVAACGGVDSRTLAAAEVTVYGDKPLPGVFCSTPPHLLKPEDKNTLPEVSDMVIDVGMQGEQARSHIRAGDRVSFRPNFHALNSHRVSGKSLDNRAGVAAILYAMDILEREGYPSDWDIAVIFAVQEELGCRGAKAASYRVAADAALAVDVSFAHTPDADPNRCGKLGDGPMIGWSPTLDEGMTRRLVELAEEKNIPYQHEVMGGETGTDAESISEGRAGTRTALLSIPLRYMHTPFEVADLRDIRHVGGLLAAFVQKGAGVL